MDGATLLHELQQRGLRLSPKPGDILHVEPSDLLTSELRQLIRHHKPALLALLTHPHINTRGELIIPSTSDRRYHYWAGGQSIAATLRELGVSEDVWRRYTDVPYGKVQ